jgi:hypothetical protein
MRKFLIVLVFVLLAVYYAISSFVNSCADIVGATLQ